jgi:molybdopterin/thiamine biosynthesis adenylyltransferase
LVISIIGLGGTGSYLATPLIRYIHSQQIAFSRIIFADGDSYENKNLDRQEFMTSWIGENKARYAQQKHSKLFPEMAKGFAFMDEYIGADNIENIMVEGGVMFICVDNNYFRKLADEQAKNMNHFTIINGGNGMLDGQVQIVQYQNGKNITKETLTSRHREIGDATKQDDRTAMSCEELAALKGGGQIVVANMVSAAIMLGYFIDYIANNQKRSFYETFFNCKDMTFRTVEV